MLLLLLLFWPWQTVSAAGLQASPSSLQVELAPNQAGQTQLVVSNPSRDLQVFEIYADDYRDVIDIQPSSFSLESGARKEVTINIKANKNFGLLQTNLSIISKPMTVENIAIQSATKIPLTIKEKAVVSDSNNSRMNYWPYLAGLIILVLLFDGWLLRKKLRKTVNTKLP